MTVSADERYMALSVRVLAECGAAEIDGIDCSQRLDPATEAAVRDAFHEHGVLVVRDQRLDAAQFASFVTRIAPLESTGSDHPGVTVEQPAEERPRRTQAAVFERWSSVVEAERAAPPVVAAPGLQPAPAAETDSILYLHPDSPDVMILTNQVRPGLVPVGIVDDAHTWHTDGEHKPEPSLGTALYALRNPSRGGDTEFCNMSMVYDALPIGTKGVVEGRLAVRHWSKARNPRIAPMLDAQTRAEYERKAHGVPEVRHPAVRTHPATGRRSLFVSPRFTIALDGLDAASSERLLTEIFGLMEEPRYRYRHRWRDGDLVIWDNRCINHRACGGYTSNDERTMLRVTLRGDRPYYRPA